MVLLGFFIQLFIIINYQFIEIFADIRTFTGRHVKIEEAPFLVKILILRKICTGSIIKSNWILTAAHCFDQSRSCKVFVGTDGTNRGEAYSIGNLYIHPLYNPGTYGSEYDLALIKLRRSIPYTNRSKIISLENRVWPYNVLKRKCYAIGYGRHESIGKSGILHGGQVTAGYGDQACCDAFTSHMKEKLICLNRNESEPTCFGDSGGPLVCDRNLVGVCHAVHFCEHTFYDSSFDVPCGWKSTIASYIYVFNNFGWLKQYVPCMPNCVDIKSQSVSNFYKNKLMHLFQMLCIILLCKIYE